MGFFDFLSNKKKPQGLIGYFQLEDWWLTELTNDEQLYILKIFNPMGSTSQSIISGNITYTTETAVGFLQNLAGWFSKDKDRPIAHKILAKAEALYENGGSVLDAHFLYGQKLEIFYKDRDNQIYFEKAVEACHQQIALAKLSADAFLKIYEGSPLPAHKGYQQLAIILEKQEKFDETIKLCEQALAQGWGGDWEKRIERNRNKKNKAYKSLQHRTLRALDAL